MTTQTLPKQAHGIVLDECSSWVERILIRTAEFIANSRSERARKAQRKMLARLSTAQLADIGLDDPQVQIRLFDAYLESESEDLDGLRRRNLVSR